MGHLAGGDSPRGSPWNGCGWAAETLNGVVRHAIHNCDGGHRDRQLNAGERLTKNGYFGQLEMRLSREFRGMREPELRGWWCDGFNPEKFVATGKGCHVSGTVWLDSGKAQTLWNFVVLLGPSVKRIDEVKWAEMVPAEDVTGWLFLDFERKFMKIKAYAGVRDPDPAAR